jgi:hypothetical protein
MPSGKNWMYFIYINLAFAIYIAGTFYLNSVQQIKANWPQYRCNPLYMPLSDNIETDFAYCIQNVQTNFMGYLLQPINYIINSLSAVGGDFSQSLNFIRTMISNIRSFFTSIIQNVFGVFLNLVIEFQKITIGIKDLVGKIIGILVTMMYIMDGALKTMQSAWNGPPGQMVQALGGMCFHPDTKIKLKNESIVMMKDLNLGDILENGSRVDVLMKVDNKFNEPYYKLVGKGVDEDTIYVTGTHMIFSETENKYIEVKNHPDAIETDIKDNWFSTIITDDHTIKIEHMFWDWEDDILKM